MNRIKAIKSFKATMSNQLSAAGLLFIGIAILSFWLYAPTSRAETSVLSQVDVTFSGLRLNRGTRTFDSVATLTNTSADPILAPVSLVIKNISPDTVSLANSAGTTADGDPFVDVPVSTDSTLTPDETISNIILQFNNPSRVGFTFDHDVLGMLEDSAPSNQPPIAMAGADFNTLTSVPVTLNGAGSYDPEGALITYAWVLEQFPGGSAAGFSGQSTPNPPFTPDVAGEYLFSLGVNDGEKDSATDHVTVTAFSTVAPPNADAGRDQQARVGESVNLDGSGSYDPNGFVLDYLWNFGPIPQNSSLTNADLSFSNTANSQFTPDVDGHFDLNVQVDNSTLTDDDTVRVTVVQPTGPNAEAGPDQTTTGTVNLDGTASFDPDPGPAALSYAWTFVSLPPGSALTNADIADAQTATPNFTPDVVGSYVVRLTVSDGDQSDGDNVLVLVDRPVIAFDQTVTTNEDMPVTIALAGDALAGVSLTIATTSSPNNGSLSGLTPGVEPLQRTATVTYTPDLNYFGGDGFTFEVCNSECVSGTVTITVHAVNDEPQITSSPVTTGMVGIPYTYSVEASDPDDDTLNFLLTTAPAGMNIDANSGVITWTPGGEGDYPVGLKVEDGHGEQAIQSYTLSIVQAPDTDGDGLSDVEESAIGTDPNNADTDGDNLNDGDEINTHNTDPLNPDTDGDGFSDGVEIQAGTDPNDANNKPGPNLPPDPSTVAPPLDRTVSTTLYSATEFLYTGTSPIQTGVDPGTIQPTRAAVIRGKVTDRSGDPLPGVTVSIHNYSEFGSTLSRLDGAFDLAVNGGGLLTLQYALAGYLPAQRLVLVPVQDFVNITDVVLVTLDTKVTTIDLTSNVPMQVARGSVVNDIGGTRQATLFFPQGTQAQAMMPDGSTQPLNTLNVRATEYSIGPEGLGAMPAPLPPNSGYTYAVELSVDEATTKINGKDVLFSQPIIFYMENFLNSAVGSTVPVGYYDNDKASWIAFDNGLSLSVLSVNNGIAELDVDGSGVAASTEALMGLGINDAERQRLAELYQPGQTLWRAALSHFSTWDLNWNFSPPDDAEFPPKDPDEPDKDENDPCQENSSIIECQNQILGEEIDIVGIPFSLNYRSNRVLGRKLAYTLDIPLSESVVPDSLIGIEVRIHVAGREFIHVLYNGKGCHPPRFLFQLSASEDTNLTKFASNLWSNPFGFFVSSAHAADGLVDPIYMWYLYRPWHCDLIDNGQIQPTTLTDQNHTFTWDGFDAYGRMMQGKQPVTVRIGYLYRGVYEKTDRFGYNGDGLITGSSTRSTLTLWRVWNSNIGAMDYRDQGLGGWSIDVQHLYDVLDRSLYLGNGERRSTKSVRTRVIDSYVSFLGNEGDCFAGNGDGGAANNAYLGHPKGLGVGPDGSVYIADSGCSRVRKVDQNGVITSVAGTGVSGFGGDNGPATSAQFANISDVAIAPDGSLYIADTDNHRVRRIDQNGEVSTFAGNGVSGFSGDNGPAINAQLAQPTGIAVGADGSVYIADKRNHRIRHVLTDGTIITVAGNGLGVRGGFGGDGGLATLALLNNPENVAVGREGSIYIADTTNNRVRQVTPDGTIQTIAGNGIGGSTADVGDGGLATDAALTPTDLAFDVDGALYIADEQARIRRIDSNNIIATVAGSFNPGGDINGDGGPATAAKLGRPLAVASGGDTIYLSTIADTVRQVGAVYPGFTAANFSMASEDGSEVYFFDDFGKHLQTRHALTSGMLYDFTYGASGHLVEITDGDGNKTQIQRDPIGEPTAIIAPFGQQTALTLDANNYLATVTNPAAEQFQMVYTADGLLTDFKDPRGNSSVFAYDAGGRLQKDTNAEGGFFQLSRVDDSGSNYDVTVSTALGRITHFRVENPPSGDQQRINTFPDGTKSTTLINANGSRTTLLADGTSTELIEQPDPRFGMQSSILQNAKVTSGNLTSTVTLTRNVNLSDPNDFLSLLSLTDELTVNERVSRNTYDAATRTFTNFSAEGRQTTQIIDSRGRTVQAKLDGLLPTVTSYDGNGRLSTNSIGIGADQRLVSFAYNPEGYLETRTDPLGRISRFEYDLAGRITRQVLTDMREILHSYDANGNLASLTPPGRPAHVFNYTKVDLTDQYTPPDINIGTTSTVYHYNLDKQLAQVSRPDGRDITFDYDTVAERLNKQTTPLGDTLYGYDAITGQLTDVTTPDAEALAYSYNGAFLSRIDWSGTVSGNVGINYDNDFRIASMNVNGANAVSYTYDKDSLLTQAGDLTLNRDVQNGLLTGSSLGLIADSYSYNGFGEITDYIAQINGSDAITFQYTYDKLGRIAGKTETQNSVTDSFEYDYDSTGRLIEVRKNNVVHTTFGYDSNGNRISVNGTVIGTYDGQDRLLTYDNASYTYNANGELQSKNESGATTNYSYDVLGNLRQVVLPGNVTINYVIDGQNRRIGKTANGTLVQGFLYQDQLNPIAELDGAGDIVSRFIYADKSNVPAYMIKSGSTYRIISDHLGSPRLVVNNSDGSVVQHMDYDVWGSVVLDTNPGFQPFGFSGGLYDQHTQLVRFGARDYDPLAGRWTSKDPILFDAGEANLYSYVLNNPTNFLDPTGQYTIFDIASEVSNESLPDAVLAGVFLMADLTRTAIDSGATPMSTLTRTLSGIGLLYKAIVGASAFGLTVGGSIDYLTEKISGKSISDRLADGLLKRFPPKKRFPPNPSVPGSDKSKGKGCADSGPSL